MTRLAVFDCDGTLVDSQHNICAAMELAYRDAALAAPSRLAIRRIVGLSVAEAVRALSPELAAPQVAALAEGYRRAFFTLRSTGAADPEPLFEGVADLLTALGKAGWLLGVATGKSDRGLAHILAHHGLSGHFVTLQTADRHPSKPHPAMLEAAMAEAGAAPDVTVMIGDTSFDMAMARAAGARPIGVAWGYHAPDELTAAGAALVVETAGALAEALA